MTNDWLQHLAELAERKPTDPETILEFRSTLEYGASDRDSDDLEENGVPHTLINEINEPNGHTEQSAQTPIATQPNPQISAPSVPHEPVSGPSSPPDAPESKPGASTGGSPVKSQSPQKRSQTTPALASKMTPPQPEVLRRSERTRKPVQDPAFYTSKDAAYYKSTALVAEEIKNNFFKPESECPEEETFTFLGRRKSAIAVTLDARPKDPVQVRCGGRRSKRVC